MIENGNNYLAEFCFKSSWVAALQSRNEGSFFFKFILQASEPSRLIADYTS